MEKLERKFTYVGRWESRIKNRICKGTINTKVNLKNSYGNPLLKKLSKLYTYMKLN